MTESREKMIRNQVRTSAVVNPKVLESMNRIPRERFVDPSVSPISYSELSLLIGCNQLMLPARTHGLIMQHIEPDPADHILIVGTGTGYLSACLSPLVKKIYAIDKYSDLTGHAKKNLEELSCKNVTTETRNFFSTPINNIFNKVIFTASFPWVDLSVGNILAANGLCFMAVGEDHMMKCMILNKLDKTLSSQEIFDDYIPQIENMPDTDRFVL